MFESTVGTLWTLFNFEDFKDPSVFDPTDDLQWCVVEFIRGTILRRGKSVVFTHNDGCLIKRLFEELLFLVFRPFVLLESS